MAVRASIGGKMFLSHIDVSLSLPLLLSLKISEHGLRWILKKSALRESSGNSESAEPTEGGAGVLEGLPKEVMTIGRSEDWKRFSCANRWGWGRVGREDHRQSPWGGEDGKFELLKGSCCSYDLGNRDARWSQRCGQVQIMVYFGLYWQDSGEPWEGAIRFVFWGNNCD